ncbi:MAG: hypothetical protein WC248_00655, partial [Candidatus Methanomethylophilaceae archaeon]
WTLPITDCRSLVVDQRKRTLARPCVLDQNVIFPRHWSLYAAVTRAAQSIDDPNTEWTSLLDNSIVSLLRGNSRGYLVVFPFTTETHGGYHLHRISWKMP